MDYGDSYQLHLISLIKSQKVAVYLPEIYFHWESLDTGSKTGLQSLNWGVAWKGMFFFSSCYG